MVKRLLALISVIVCMMLVASPAGGWSNGSAGPDSFGTHDWVLDRALGAVTPDWVDVDVALGATDDPDTVDEIDYASGTWWHVYDEWGDAFGGAPEAVEHWFSSIQNHLAVGETDLASVELGYLAHIIGDLAQPMHTDSSRSENKIHSSYERAVDRKVDAGRLSFSYDGGGAFDAYDSALALARQSHGSYRKLVYQYSEYGYNAEVGRITRRQLNRGANVLADAMAALGTAGGGSPSPSPTPSETDGPSPDPTPPENTNCDAAYPDVCIPSPPPDLDCGDITHRNFRVIQHPDPHGFDGNNDGYGCES